MKHIGERSTHSLKSSSVIKSQKQGYRWPHKKDWCPSKRFWKFSLYLAINLSKTFKFKERVVTTKARFVEKLQIHFAYGQYKYEFFRIRSNLLNILVSEGHFVCCKFATTVCILWTRTIAHDALDLTIEAPHQTQPPPQTRLLTVQGPLQPCPTPLCTWDLTVQVSQSHWCWHLVTTEACMVSTSDRYASYYNTFLFAMQTDWGKTEQLHFTCKLYCSKTKFNFRKLSSTSCRFSKDLICWVNLSWVLFVLLLLFSLLSSVSKMSNLSEKGVSLISWS